LNFDQRLQRISTSLVNAGFDVSLVGRKLQSSPKLLEQNFEQKRFNCLFNKGVLFYIEMNIRIFFHLLVNQPAIVVANDLDTVLGVYFGAKYFKITKIFDAHELFTEVPELRSKKFKKNIWSWIEKRYLPAFQKHYTVNNSLAKIFKERLNIDFEVVRNLPFRSKLKKLKGKREPFILYQGALNKGRGLPEIIQVMLQVDMQLKIAGDGDITAELKRQVKELKLEDKVFFLGKLKPVSLQKITQEAFIGLNLLENTSLNYYYSLANKFFDYIQAEIPQICMNFPEYKILNKENEVAVLVKNLDKVSLLKAIKTLQDESFYKQLQSNCKKAKNKFLWEREELKLKDVYF
tara:strand:+ start:7032 stop:8075 length:1044 start_codon:yes stop_codon:yes gene_type:complete